MRARAAGTILPALCVAAAMLVAACSADDEATTSSAALPTTTLPTTTLPTTTTVPDVVMTAEDFKPLAAMTPVRGFFVDNVLGDLEATVAVAESADGGEYPVGSVIQLVPQEAMVKRAPGFSPGLGDWEFFILEVSKDGTVIGQRGNAEIKNRFGLSCGDCHAMAEPQFDFVCEQDHGCNPLPIDRAIIEAIQSQDPRPVP